MSVQRVCLMGAFAIELSFPHYDACLDVDCA
jgi:hypothetical protein